MPFVKITSNAMRIGIIFFSIMMFLVVGCNQGNKKNNQEDLVGSKDSLQIQHAITDEKDKVIHAFVGAFSKKDATLINALIHPELGMKIIFRPGVSDRFYQVENIDFFKPVPEYYPYPDIKNKFELHYEKLPEFDCGTEKWNKQGLFCDSTQNPKQLSEIISFEKEFEPNNYPDSYEKEIQELERDSYRVILTGENPLIFHIKRYNGKWYITVLDRAYAGCDA